MRRDLDALRTIRNEIKYAPTTVKATPDAASAARSATTTTTTPPTTPTAQ